MSSTFAEARPNLTPEQHRVRARIGPAADSARRWERYPYRPRKGCDEDMEAIRDEIDEVLRGVIPMIYYQLRRRLPSMSDFDLDDAVQRSLIKLTRRDIPNFDSSTGTKLTTYLYRSIQLHVGEEVQRLARRLKPAQKRLPDPLSLDEIVENAHGYANELIATDRSMDRKVYQIAADVFTNPRKYFTRRQAEAIAILRNDTDPTCSRAQKIGVKHTQAVSMLLARCRRRLLKKVGDIEDFELSQK